MVSTSPPWATLRTMSGTELEGLPPQVLLSDVQRLLSKSHVLQPEITADASIPERSEAARC